MPLSEAEIKYRQSKKGRTTHQKANKRYYDRSKSESKNQILLDMFIVILKMTLRLGLMLNLNMRVGYFVVTLLKYIPLKQS